MPIVTRPDTKEGRDPFADRRFTLAQSYAAEGLWIEAADLYEQALERAPTWVAAWIGHGDALAASREPARAIAAFRRALLLDPDDAQGAALRLATLDPAQMPPTASAAYVGALFDAYAKRFEAHLTQGLTYRGPALLVAALAQAGHNRFTRVLDLGCGTGLVGMALRSMAEQIEGVDLSAAMIAEAQAKAIYDRLAVGDILPFLEAEATASTDLVIAADVFVYIGDLAPILTEAARVVRPGGAVAFTTQSPEGQALDDLGYRIGADLRFTHTRHYIATTFQQAGFALVYWADDSARREKNRDVPGAVVVGSRL